ncbi:DUF724 domain-containing protein 3-like isoform X2 [Durio zibethinus]|uniref:DUF724 domain-containing protein 3-like isoform X2 n=1 Tax=Durio zibethinus TaxID=66656 RepID=A0A6P5WTZ5_DURZI|nr:DUF724 domain-containing protein 3-like isoform X2 [Durio zibethinus]
MPPKRKPTAAPATDDPPHPQPGSQVEISSNHPRFQGSWFTGSIIKRASSRNPNKFLAQYTLLFQDEAGTKPLKETIDAVDIRPLAPRERARKFKFGEEVDAFHNSGWWEGVITKELENGKFHVYFKRLKEQLEFGEDQLRLNRQWVNGSWTPPLEEDGQVEEKVQTEKEVKSNKVVTLDKLKCDNAASKLKSDKAGNGEKLESGKITTDKKFNEGEHVEVTSGENGFQGAWFAATIVKAVGKDRYLIQYECLRNEADTDFLKEEFDTLHIRPYPPEVVVADRFEKLDEVDALYNDGWWAGVISKVVSDSKYEVYFKNTKEKMKFDDSELRLHQDWIDGKWVAASRTL